MNTFLQTQLTDLSKLNSTPKRAKENYMKKFLFGLMVAIVAVLGLSKVATAACNNNPCLYQPPVVVYKYIYVTKIPKKATVSKISTFKPKPHVLVMANTECVFVPFPRGHASQPVLFFQFKEDAHCQKAKTYCTECTDWIHGERGDVFGPAAGMLGGNSVAYAVPSGAGALVPRNRRGRVAYCDQASKDNNPSSSWHFVD